MTKRILTMDDNGNQSWEDSPLFSKDINVAGGVVGADENGKTPGIISLSGTLTIATTDADASTIVTDVGFIPSIVYLIASDDADATCNSNGWVSNVVGNAVIQGSTSAQGTVLGSSFTYALDVEALVQGVATGWRSTVTFATTTFVLTNSKLDAGKNVTIKYLAIK